MRAILAIDQRQNCDVPVAHAIAWAARFGASLDLVTVSEDSGDSDHRDASFLTQETERRESALQGDLGRYLEAVPTPMRGDVHVLRGRVAPALIEFSAKWDLLVLATHGRQGLSRLFAGSVAESTIRSVSCPVLVTRTDGEPVPLDGPLKIVLPIDSEQPISDGIRTANSLLGPEHDYRALYAMPDIAAIDDMYGSWCEQRMGAATAAGGLPNIPRIVRAYRGNPGDDVANFAREIQAQLIVMPTHTRTAIGRLAFGSVAERVIRVAPCPVLVTR